MAEFIIGGIPPSVNPSQQNEFEDDPLTLSEEITLELILNLARKRGYCYCPNDKLAAKRKKSIPTITRHVSKFCRLGLLKFRRVGNKRWLYPGINDYPMIRQRLADDDPHNTKASKDSKGKESTVYQPTEQSLESVCLEGKEECHAERKQRGDITSYRSNPAENLDDTPKRGFSQSAQAHTSGSTADNAEREGFANLSAFVGEGVRNEAFTVTTEDVQAAATQPAGVESRAGIRTPDYVRNISGGYAKAGKAEQASSVLSPELVAGTQTSVCLEGKEECHDRSGEGGGMAKSTRSRRSGVEGTPARQDGIAAGMEGLEDEGAGRESPPEYQRRGFDRVQPGNGNAGLSTDTQTSVCIEGKEVGEESRNRPPLNGHESANYSLSIPGTDTQTASPIAPGSAQERLTAGKRETEGDGVTPHHDRAVCGRDMEAVHILPETEPRRQRPRVEAIANDSIPQDSALRENGELHVMARNGTSQSTESAPRPEQEGKNVYGGTVGEDHRETTAEGSGSGTTSTDILSTDTSRTAERTNGCAITDKRNTQSPELASLIAEGVETRTATAIAATHSRETLDRYIRAYQVKKAAGKAGGVGWLISAILNSWSVKTPNATPAQITAKAVMAREAGFVVKQLPALSEYEGAAPNMASLRDRLSGRSAELCGV